MTGAKVAAREAMARIIDYAEGSFGSFACRRVPEQVLADSLFADVEDGADLVESAAEVS
jgi:hypothetical protein